MAAETHARVSMKNRLQHHILNWIVISRYRMVHRGIPKTITQRCLVLLEVFLKRINLITS